MGDFPVPSRTTPSWIKKESYTQYCQIIIKINCNIKTKHRDFLNVIYKTIKINNKKKNLIRHCPPSTCTCLFRDGYNKWRDAKKPTTILAELCRKNGLQCPEYRTNEVKVLNKIFKIPPDAVPEGRATQRSRIFILVLCISDVSISNSHFGKCCLQL